MGWLIQLDPDFGEKFFLAGDLDHGQDGRNQSGIYVSDCTCICTAGDEEDPIFQNLSDNVRIAYGNCFLSGGSDLLIYLPAEERTFE